jgi:hypothetical protein
MDLAVQEAMLAEELELILHPPDGWDQSAELGNARAHTDRIDGERATEAERLSQQVVRSAGLQRQSMGLSFGTATAPATSGRPPHHSCKICVNIYIYRYFIRMMENLCHYTPETSCPQPQ